MSKMLDGLLGTDNLTLKFFIAFAVVLALIGLAAWLVRRFGSARLGGGARGRQPRLAVIDAAAVDGRRRLVLIRRDNVEHLLMIGGPTDVVIEPNIVRATGGRDVTRDVAREPARVNGESSARQAAAVESSWPLQPLSEPAPIPPPRGFRPSTTEEPWLPPEPGARPRPADNHTRLAAELSTRLGLPEVAAPAARIDPPQRPSPPPMMPPEPAAPAQTDHNLAEMAQQLEAALRRSPMPESRAPVTDPLAAQAKAAAARDIKPRVEPKLEPKIEPKIEPKTEPKIEPKVAAKIEPKIEPKVEAPPAPPAVQKAEPKPEPAASPAKAPLDSLEEEMANLLGRPPGKT